MFDIAGQTVIPNWLKLLEGTHWYPRDPIGTPGNPLVPQGSHWYPREPISTPGIPLVPQGSHL